MFKYLFLTIIVNCSLLIAHCLHAQDYKKEAFHGNKAFKKKNYQAAIEYYQNAVAFVDNPTSVHTDLYYKLGIAQFKIEACEDVLLSLSIALNVGASILKDESKFDIIDMQHTCLLKMGIHNPEMQQMILKNPTKEFISEIVSKIKAISEELSPPVDTVETQKFSQLTKEELEEKVPVILDNIYFEIGKSTLLPGSYPQLDILAKLLVEKPLIKIKILGHADKTGLEEANLELSADRAKAVMDYLTEKGIAPERILHQGLGSSNPIASNETEEGRAKNRRVEFVIE